MRVGKVIALVAVAAIVIASCCDVYTATEYTCLECRASLHKRQICGVPINHVAQNAYSESVLAHAPEHQHQWCWCGTRRRYSLRSIGRECGHQHPIWMLPIPMQAQYAQLVPEPELHNTLRAIDVSDRNAAEAAVLQVQKRVLELQH